jgi:hypothetical protein
MINPTPWKTALENQAQHPEEASQSENRRANPGLATAGGFSGGGGGVGESVAD